MDSRGLPFGRPPTQPPQNQFVDERRRSLPSTGGWTISSIRGEVFTEVSNGTLDANTLVLNYLGVITEDYLLTTAAASVITAAALATAASGLYVLATDGRDRVFRLVPGTGVSYDANTAGRKAVPLKAPTTLLAGTRLFMGALVSSATAEFAIAQGHTTNVEKIRTYTTTVLPQSLRVSDTMESTTTPAALMVVYYSAEAALVI